MLLSNSALLKLLFAHWLICAFLDQVGIHFGLLYGAVGMGLPDAAIPSIPSPLLFALSNDRGGLEGANYINERAMHQRKFAVCLVVMR